jgi:hypothetical protein
MQYPFSKWLWRVTNPRTGKRYTTRYRMTEADARDTDPTAEKIESSRVLIAGPALDASSVATAWPSGKPPG